ncbi:efflux RND transporter permease subunit, partial [Vibrio parahaemolyticus]|uniref:efflux RND transporter permease subunit n=1 Tax=Vibrio parahaemolyticus TaxID=670 RepID=UPI001A8EE58D|nr:efflux RND transporter permease subunit [Vibrio parahaemolyticus]
DRPIFASVISLIILIVGSIAYFTLPVAQFPEIVPPTISVGATYPGANAVTVSDTVATVLEQEITGVEDMIYMYSQSTDDGVMSL